MLPFVAVAAAAPSIPFETWELENGLRVLLAEDHRLPLVTVNTWYHVGAANEEPGKSGFAHLFEHIMFQGSRDVAEDTFFRHLEGAGASDVNGTTGFDRTNYYETVPANQLALALWLESDRMGFLTDTLTAERLENQRDVVRKERQQNRENTPYGTAYERVYQLLFPAPHPYHGVVMGSHEDLERASLEDVTRFFRTYYAPNNATLVILGDVDRSTVETLVQRYYGGLPAQPEPPALTLSATDYTAALAAPPPAAPLVGTAPADHAELTDEVEVPAVFTGWRGPGEAAPGDLELTVASVLLGLGRSSRLYQELVYERRVASDVSASWEPARLGGVFEVTVFGKPDSDPVALARAVDEVVDALRTEGPTEEELERVRRWVLAQVLGSLQSQGERADTLNHYHSLGDPGGLDADLERLRTLTAPAVHAALKAVLVPEARVVVTVTPAPEAK